MDFKKSQRRIMHIDDEPLVLKCFSMFLKCIDSEAEIIQAKSGNQGYSQFENLAKNRTLPNLVFTDLHMEDGDGIFFSERVRAYLRDNPCSHRVSIVALTGFSNSLTPESRTHFDYIAQKPLTLNAFKELYQKFVCT